MSELADWLEMHITHRLWCFWLIHIWFAILFGTILLISCSRWLFTNKMLRLYMLLDAKYHLKFGFLVFYIKYNLFVLSSL